MTADCNNAFLTANMLLKRFWKLFLTTACAQVNIPNARIEGVLFPNFVRSELDGRDESAELEQGQPRFWNFTGKVSSQYVCTENQDIFFSFSPTSCLNSR